MDNKDNELVGHSAMRRGGRAPGESDDLANLQRNSHGIIFKWSGNKNLKREIRGEPMVGDLQETHREVCLEPLVNSGELVRSGAKRVGSCFFLMRWVN